MLILGIKTKNNWVQMSRSDVLRSISFGVNHKQAVQALLNLTKPFLFIYNQQGRPIELIDSFYRIQVKANTFNFIRSFYFFTLGFNDQVCVVT